MDTLINIGFAFVLLVLIIGFIYNFSMFILSFRDDNPSEYP